MNTAVPEAIFARLQKALGGTVTTFTHQRSATGEPTRVIIGVRAMSHGNPREKTIECFTQDEIDAGWQKLADLAEARLVKP